jgi:hypothetical protein
VDVRRGDNRISCCLLQVTRPPLVLNLPEYLTRTEITRLFGMDSRTAISRFGIKPDGIVLSGTRRFTIYNAAKLKLLVAKTNEQELSSNKRS